MRNSTKCLFKILLLIEIFILAGGYCFSQQQSFEQKIHPLLRKVINQKEDVLQYLDSRVVPTFFIEPAKKIINGKSGEQLVERSYQCIIYTKNIQALRDSGIFINSALKNFVTASLTPEQIIRLAKWDIVSYIDAPRQDHLSNDIAVAAAGASLLHQGRLNNTVYKGKNSIIAIFDSGIDWKHPDFRDPVDQTKSRILKIWDQTLTPKTGEVPPAGFNYGVEYTQAQINAELGANPPKFVREKDVNGHGTHVAGTAAGNGSALPSKKYTGLAPEADIIVIKGGDGSFSTTNEINGIEYLKNLANTLGRPIILNMSLGGQYGPHDGTQPNEQAVDEFTTSGEGRVVVIAAGNDNGTALHNRILLNSSAGASMTFSIPSVKGKGYALEYIVYANDGDNVTATLTGPDGKSVTAIAGSEADSASFGTGGKVKADLYNYIDPDNNDRFVQLDIYMPDSANPGGNWKLALKNNTTNNLTMDGWMDYKGTGYSNITLSGSDNKYLVATPGNATTAITAAAYDTKVSWYSSNDSSFYAFTGLTIDSLASFSSRGPRRDGVIKPEISAPGAMVVSCLSSNSAPAASDIIEKGLYLEAEGTSMATPVVTGSAALLLQANPNATAAQIKDLLLSNTIRDVFTESSGATPNAAWGYGKTDVFKAASALFNCTPASRKTYQYDGSYLTGQDVGERPNPLKIATRFTPDINGKLGNIYFHTSGAVTSLVMEIRTNNAGKPGTLLGTMNIDSSKISLYTWNYADVSGLNIDVTASKDYFVVLYRNPSVTNEWGIRTDTISVDNRSFTSADNGTTWTLHNRDYKIRSVVYDNGQLSGNIATATSKDSRDINTSNQFRNSNCELITQLLPAGAKPVSGVVNSKVWIESSVPHTGDGNAFVARHYEVTPNNNSTEATGKVTLYFKQSEFTDFNNASGSTLKLPANNTDAAGIANLRIGKYPGVSSDSSGLPFTYNGVPEVINPDDNDVVWNAAANRWEVSFDVTGFSGFIVQTTASVLPIKLVYFRGSVENSANVLTWKENCYDNAVTFDLERSNNGADFTGIGKINATADRCTQPFNYSDASRMQGTNYYRLQITDGTGNHFYSEIISLQNSSSAITSLYPTVISNGMMIHVNLAGAAGYLIISDAAGKKLYTQKLYYGTQNIALPALVSGIYLYTIQNANNTATTGKIIVH